MGATSAPAVPDAEAQALYRALLEGGGQFGPERVAAAEVAAFERLRAVGLVVEQPDGLWTVTNPRVAVARISAGLRSASRAVLDRADEFGELVDELALAYDRAAAAPKGGGSIEELTELSQTQQRIEQLAAECTRDILTAQPGGSRRLLWKERTFDTARRLQQRGVRMRTLYHRAALAHPDLAEYAAFATGLGHQVRALDEDFPRAMVFDRAVAVVAGYPGRMVASIIEDPVLVEVVVNQFERDWARAARVGRPEPTVPEDARLVELLATGLTQQAVASRLGLSERTVAARISRLRERHDAQTLFQLGWQIRAAEPSVGG
ncbi:LuxR C-terminal-related transcriptional regulator [Kitasatospora sp. LaBMicrA B282]|uniref:LuxR C-terminal-related transcriptional regulator n=1 Tax=Kitasatospora sp. LaBMicrA B282 TaxID=3420949 RepID=UPI003D0E8CB5